MSSCSKLLEVPLALEAVRLEAPLEDESRGDAVARRLDQLEIDVARDALVFLREGTEIRELLPLARELDLGLIEDTLVGREPARYQVPSEVLVDRPHFRVGRVSDRRIEDVELGLLARIRQAEAGRIEREALVLADRRLRGVACLRDVGDALLNVRATFLLRDHLRPGQGRLGERKVQVPEESEIETAGFRLRHTLLQPRLLLGELDVGIVLEREPHGVDQGNAVVRKRQRGRVVGRRRSVPVRVRGEQRTARYGHQENDRTQPRGQRVHLRTPLSAAEGAGEEFRCKD
ncbi:MAG: hypothetical protein LC729_02170 [Acidobacteria bacterium]|nr:hypothetical protein [Acidobacteriota bacterium]